MNINSLLEKSSTYLKKNEIQMWMVTAATLSFNAFGILSLLKGDFNLFIVLIIVSHFLDMLDKYNRKKKSNSIQFLEWVKLISIFFVFTRVYKPYITNNVIIVVLVLLLLSNLDYTVDASIKVKQKKENDAAILFWTKLMRKLDINTLVKIKQLTDIFNEDMTYMYLIIIMIYIHYSI